MKFIPITTRTFLPPRDDIYDLLDSSLPALQEGDIVFITSKVLAIAQGRCIKIDSTVSKNKLIAAEADYLLPHRVRMGTRLLTLTIKDSTLIPTAGIDESNANGHYILWPEHTNDFLRDIWRHLRKKHGIKKLGVVATDSHTTPVRRGVGGISTGIFGIHPLSDYRGKPDIFGRELKMTQVNIVDALAATVVLLMGEGKERTPLVICRGYTNISFTNKHTYHELVMDPKFDIYRPLLQHFRKQRRKK
jgi:dihydrofolate synthase / folylpolyglutamate synthase